MIFSCTVFAICRRYKRCGMYKNVVIEETFAVLQCWRSCLVIIWRPYVMTSPTTGPQSWSLAIPDYNSPINISESPQLHADLQLLTTFLAVSKCGSHSTWAKPLYINTHICTVRINTQSNIYLSFHRWRAVGNTVSQSKKKIRAQSIREGNWVKGQAGVSLSARWPQTQTRLFLFALRLPQRGVAGQDNSLTPLDSV